MTGQPVRRRRKPRPLDQVRPRRPRPKGLTGWDLAAWRMPEKGPNGLQALFDSAVASLPRPVEYHHDTDSRLQAAGWLDCLVFGDGGAMFAELKREGEDPTLAQERVLGRARRSGAFRFVRVYRPSDWYAGTVTRELAIIAGVTVLAERGRKVTL